jgi:hypothetical protein
MARTLLPSVSRRPGWRGKLYCGPAFEWSLPICHLIGALGRQVCAGNHLHLQERTR